MRHCDRSVAPKRADPNAISAGHATGTDYSSDYCAVWCYPYCVTSAVTAVLSVLRDQCCAVLALHSTVLPVVLVRYSTCSALESASRYAPAEACAAERANQRGCCAHGALSRQRRLRPFALLTLGHHESACATVPQYCPRLSAYCASTVQTQFNSARRMLALLLHCFVHECASCRSAHGHRGLDNNASLQCRMHLVLSAVPGLALACPVPAVSAGRSAAAKSA